MKVESRQLLQDVLRRDVDRPVDLLRDGAQRFERRGREEHGFDLVPACRGQTLEEQSSLGDEETLRSKPGMIAYAPVRLEPGILGRADGQDHSPLRTTDLRLRWLSITCWPSRFLRKTLDSPVLNGCSTKRITSKWSCASALRIS